MLQVAADSDGGTTGQLVEVKFMPRTAARKDYTLFVVCDSWIGADRILPLKLKASSDWFALSDTQRYWESGIQTC
jgi:hypothetical protein